jgi:transcription elongation factor Elf1
MAERNQQWTGAYRLTDKKRQEILERDGFTCIYCNETAECVDHIVPYSWIHDNSDDNLVASCNICNWLASNMVFSGLREKKAYIMGRRKRSKKYTLKGIFKDYAFCGVCGVAYKPRAKGSTRLVCNKCIRLKVKY